MSKLETDDTLQDIVAKMSEGNPGAINVMMQIITSKNFTEYFPLFLKMDNMEIYGPRIWLAYKDYAGNDLEKMIKGIEKEKEELIEIIKEE